MRIALWKKAVTRHLMPRLEGDWMSAGDGTVVRKPTSLFACSFGPLNSNHGGGYFLLTAVQALYVPEGARWSSDISIRLHDHGNQLWRDFTNVDEAEPDMTRMAHRINTEAVAFFDKHATLEQYRQKCASYNRRHSPDGLGNAHMLRHEAFTEVLLGLHREAIDSFTLITRIADRYGPDAWLTRLAAEADEYLARLAADPEDVRAAILAGITVQRTALKIPPDCA